MSTLWHPPVPGRVTDAAGNPWLIRRAWPGTEAGDYIVEVQQPGSADVAAGRIERGLFEPVLLNDPGLPSLARQAARGTTVVHRAHKRAVIRAAGQYIKVFRPGRATHAALRHGLAADLISGIFDAPAILDTAPDTIVFSALPGQSFFDLGQNHAEVTDAVFAHHWSRWSRKWAATVSRSAGSGCSGNPDAQPTHTASTEAEVLMRWVGHWLHHSAGVPEAAATRSALAWRARAVTEELLRTPADPLVWAHGDLHDKQLLGTCDEPRIGLLDFDGACVAEAALDLANLDVHLALRHRQGKLTGRRYAIAHHHVLATANHLRVSPQRFAAYSASTRLRLACLYSFRPPWGPRAVSYLT